LLGGLDLVVYLVVLDSLLRATTKKKMVVLATPMLSREVGIWQLPTCHLGCAWCIV